MRLLPGILCWLIVLAHGTALAQEPPPGYPNRPIRFIVSVSPGAGADAIARAAAQMVTERWGQNVVVDSRPGGGGVIAAELVARSAPDGYTLLSIGENILLMGVLRRLPFDVLKAYEPIVPTSTQPYILLAGP